MGLSQAHSRATVRLGLADVEGRGPRQRSTEVKKAGKFCRVSVVRVHGV